MRLVAAMIIIVVAFVITAFNLGSSLILTRNTLNVTKSEDLSLARDIANDFVSMRISIYKSDARIAAEKLMKIGSREEMEIVMRELLDEYMDFMAFTMFDRQGILAMYGDSPTSIDWFDQNKYINDAFGGRTVISTTRRNEITGKLVMHIVTPMEDERILSVTISGMIFSDLFEKYILRDTRSIFMLDEYGTVIAHFMPELVASRADFVNAQGSFNPQASINILSEMMESDKGLGNYFIGGIEYQCAYAKVNASETGWYIGLSVPMHENLVDKLQKRLLILAAIFFAVAAAIAVICSGQIAKPYNKIAEQNHRLEELNKINSLQTERIMEAHQMTKLMMDATPICSMLWDRSGNLFDCNEQTIKTFGMKSKLDFLNQFYNLSPEYQSNGWYSRDLAMSLIFKTFQEGRNYFEWMHQMPDGTPVPCHITFVRIEKDNDFIVAAYARDLREHNRMMEETRRLQTELKAALKEAQEANRAKSSFLANMSHEMRTPLNAVIGLSEIILNAKETPSQEAWSGIEEKLGNIHSSGMTLLGIVNDILDISKIESGKFELHPVEYETPTFINDIVSLNIVRIGEKPIVFQLTVDENLPVRLFGDDLRIKQIFNNLLSNAFKYTNAGEVDWIISFERDGDSIWLVSEVKDTGMGIKKEDIPKLFKDYTQVDAQTNRKTEGTGLGLSITKHLVEMMDGTITVRSEYGKGLTISVRIRQKFLTNIPIGLETACNLMNARFTDIKRAQSAGFKREDLSYARVLVVDDIQVNLDIAKGMMTPYGLCVDCALSGRQAVNMIRAEETRYDAVFMDHMMPEMDGVEAMNIIRSEIGTDYAKNVPIIALTANAVEGNEKMLLKSGFQAFISKPIDMIRLDSVLRHWVRKNNFIGEKEMEDNSGNQKEVSGMEGKNNPHIKRLRGVTIDGINLDSKLESFACNEDVYIKVLKSYVVNTRPLLKNLKKYLEDGNLADYAIAVHGIKGSSYGIGAAQTGAAAEHLEHLAKAGMKEQVLAENASFIVIMENLLKSISGALDIVNNERKKPLISKPDPALLKELREACVEYDMARVDKIMEQLESFEYEAGSQLIIWLQEQVEEMSFSEISSGNWPKFDVKSA